MLPTVVAHHQSRSLPLPGSAWFWSGVAESDATAFAASRGGTTLEGMLASQGVATPAWDSSDAAIKAFWTNASRSFAENASGSVHVVQSAQVRLSPSTVWASIEWPALLANPNVTSIVAVDPSTGIETILKVG